ncbi:MAG: hypothetical protein ACRCZI_02685, partial [Cetobacterium sp.]
AISHKKFRAKASQNKDSIEQNLIKDIVVTAPNQVWVTDITYIWTKKDRCTCHLLWTFIVEK